MTASKKGGVQTQMAGEDATGSVLERASAVSALRDPGLMAASLMTWPADDLRRFARLREDISKNAISFKAGVVKCMLRYPRGGLECYPHTVELQSAYPL